MIVTIHGLKKMKIRDNKGQFLEDAVKSYDTGFKKGNISWTKIHGHTEETKKKISEALKKSKKFRFSMHSEERKRKIAKKISETRRDINNPRYKGGKYKNKSGYILILNPDRFKESEILRMDKPKNAGYILEHRYLIEKHLGRKLTKNESVHHINGIKDDNRLENLIIVINKMHFGDVDCPHCLKRFRVK